MKIAIILPYFGRFDSLFPLWLNSCRANADIDWFVFTDDTRTFDYPSNVKVTIMSFEELQKKVQALYDFPIELDTPYRLCNFKPAYGEIFEEYLDGYDAWGYCDNDMIYGRIPKANEITSDTLKYKIGSFGHLSYIENTKESRKLYRYNDAYRTVFSTSRPLFFDEGLFQDILSVHGYKEYSMKIADFMPRLFEHQVLNEPGREWMNKAHCFVWHKGELWRYYVDKNGSVSREQYDYIHFLKRPMDVPSDLDLAKPIVIIPNKLLNMNLEDITPGFLREVSKSGIFWKYWKNSFKPKNFIDRFLNRLYRNAQDKALIDKLSKQILS